MSIGTFETVVDAIATTLEQIAGALPGTKNFRWTGQQAFTPPACWIGAASMSNKRHDPCTVEHGWMFPLWFSVAVADSADAELTRLEQVVDVASLALERHCSPAVGDQFTGHRAEIVSARITDPTESGTTAFVVQLRVTTRIQTTS